MIPQRPRDLSNPFGQRYSNVKVQSPFRSNRSSKRSASKPRRRHKRRRSKRLARPKKNDRPPNNLFCCKRNYPVKNERNDQLKKRAEEDHHKFAKGEQQMSVYGSARSTRSRKLPAAARRRSKENKRPQKREISL